MRLRNVLIIAVGSFLLCSCDWAVEAYQETFNQSDNNAEKAQGTAQNVEGVNLLDDAAQLDEAQNRLQAMFPGQELRIFPPHIYFETKRIRLQLLDPNIPENVDWYYYQADKGAWEKEDPVKLRADEERQSIPLSAVKFSTAQSVYRQVVAKAEAIEGAELPTSLYFSFHVKVWNWNTRISGSRADYDFEADQDGKEIEFKKL